jgi:hypothetical protein
MIRRLTARLGMQIRIGCHALCATAITVVLEAGGTPENAHVMVAHQRPRRIDFLDSMTTRSGRSKRAFGGETTHA